MTVRETETDERISTKEVLNCGRDFQCLPTSASLLFLGTREDHPAHSLQLSPGLDCELKRQVSLKHLINGVLTLRDLLPSPQQTLKLGAVA